MITKAENSSSLTLVAQLTLTSTSKAAQNSQEISNNKFRKLPKKNPQIT